LPFNATPRSGKATTMQPGVRLGLIGLGTALYLGAAIAGEGGFASFFAHPALTALAAVQVALSVAAFFAGGNISAGVREDRGNRWVLGAFGMLGVASAVLPAYTDRIGVWTIDGDAVRWPGVVLFAAGGALRLWPVFVLGERFSGLVAIQQGHRLVTHGPYRVIRHPSYLGLIVNMLGWSLAFRSGVGLLLTALTLVPLRARIVAEERLLGATFGAEYQAYRARTWRLMPWCY